MKSRRFTLKLAAGAVGLTLAGVALVYGNVSQAHVSSCPASLHEWQSSNVAYLSGGGAEVKTFQANALVGESSTTCTYSGTTFVTGTSQFSYADQYQFGKSEIELASNGVGTITRPTYVNAVS